MVVTDHGELARKIGLSNGKIARLLQERHGRECARQTVRTILTGEGGSFFSQDLKALVEQTVEKEADNVKNYLLHLSGGNAIPN